MVNNTLSPTLSDSGHIGYRRFFFFWQPMLSLMHSADDEEFSKLVWESKNKQVLAVKKLYIV